MFVFKNKKTEELLEVCFEQYDDDSISNQTVTLTTAGDTVFIGKNRDVMDEILKRTDQGIWSISNMRDPYLENGLEMSDYYIAELIVK